MSDSKTDDLVPVIYTYAWIGNQETAEASMGQIRAYFTSKGCDPEKAVFSWHHHREIKQWFMIGSCLPEPAKGQG